MQGLQTPGAPPAQPVAPAQEFVVLVMSDDEQRRLERFVDSSLRHSVVPRARMPRVFLISVSGFSVQQGFVRLVVWHLPPISLSGLPSLGGRHMKGVGWLVQRP